MTKISVNDILKFEKENPDTHMDRCRDCSWLEFDNDIGFMCFSKGRSIYDVEECEIYAPKGEAELTRGLR